MLSLVDFYNLDLELSVGREQSLYHTSLYERTHSKMYETTQEVEREDREYTLYGLNNYVLQFIGAEPEDKPTVSDVPQNPHAPVYTYYEDLKTPHRYARFRDIRDVAKSRNLTQDAMLKKLSYTKNTSSNRLVFVVTKFYKKTFKAIYSAMMSGKDVYVVTKFKTFKSLKPESKDLNQLSRWFEDSLNEFKYSMEVKTKRELKLMRTQSFGIYDMSLNQRITLEALKSLYEIEGNDTECMTMVKYYLEYKIAPTCNLSGSSTILDSMRYIPLTILEWLVPMLNIQGEVEYFGNEDYLDSQDEESYY